MRGPKHPYYQGSLRIRVRVRGRSHKRLIPNAPAIWQPCLPVLCGVVSTCLKEENVRIDVSQAVIAHNYSIHVAARRLLLLLFSFGIVV